MFIKKLLKFEEMEENELTDTEVKKILELSHSDEGTSIDPKRAFLVEQGIWSPDEANKTTYVKNHELVGQGLTLHDYDEGDYIDASGNIRIFRVQFKTLRKLGILTTFDPETGDEMVKFVDEEYPINEDIGETIEYIHVS